MLAVLDPILEKHAGLLGDNDQLFARRVFSTPVGHYRERLEALGFSGLGRVLDAGCGFGQWTLQLCALNAAVDALDVAASRLEVLRDLSRACGVGNLSLSRGRIEELPYGDATFDAVFCYGVLFHSDWLRSLAELARVLLPGGLLYVTANGLGWYLHLWQAAPHQTVDYDPRRYAAQTLLNTVNYEQRQESPREAGILIEPGRLASEVTELGLTVLGLGPDASVSTRSSSKRAVAFFAAEYCGETGPYELLARKRPG